jgi:hypothetical protein
LPFPRLRLAPCLGRERDDDHVAAVRALAVIEHEVERLGRVGHRRLLEVRARGRLFVVSPFTGLPSRATSVRATPPSGSGVTSYSSVPVPLPRRPKGFVCSSRRRSR